MTDERSASEAQFNFAKSLGINLPENCSMTEARRLIDEAKNGAVKSSQEKFKPKTYGKPDTSHYMLVAYAKDLVIAGKTPAEAVDIVRVLNNGLKW